MAERRKKIETGDQGTEAAAKKPRSRKVRTEPAVNEAVPPPAQSRPEEQAPQDTPQAQDPVSGGPRALLPGELYRRQDQWWWRVQLPGEDKAAARPLKTNGEETPADGRGDVCVARTAAEKIALAMWEHAIEENAARRIRLESTEKIERLKAQFLDKVRHFTELVETANGKVEAEQRARAEAEAKLAQMVQATGPMTGGTPALGGHPEHVGPSPSGVNPFDRQPGAAVPPIEQAGPETPIPIPHPPIAPLPTLTPDLPAAIAPVPTSVQAPSPCERIPVHANPVEQTDPVVAPATVPLPAFVETGMCECCGATGVAMTHLTHIDSGQLLCPRCLAALRAEATRSA